MDKKRMAELEKIESHGTETGWVAPMTAEDRAFFAYFRSVFKRYNISPSKATRLEYDFVTRVAESEFYLQKVNARCYSLSIAPQLLSRHPAKTTCITPSSELQCSQQQRKTLPVRHR